MTEEKLAQILHDFKNTATLIDKVGKEMRECYETYKDIKRAYDKLFIDLKEVLEIEQDI